MKGIIKSTNQEVDIFRIWKDSDLVEVFTLTPLQAYEQSKKEGKEIRYQTKMYNIDEIEIQK